MTMEESVTKRLKKPTVTHGTKNGMDPPVALGNKNDMGKIIAKPDSADLIDGAKNRIAAAVSR
jgi:hypothetical protein